MTTEGSSAWSIPTPHLPLAPEVGSGLGSLTAVMQRGSHSILHARDWQSKIADWQSKNVGKRDNLPPYNCKIHWTHCMQG